MRWVAMAIMWLAVAGATLGTAYFLRPDNHGATAFVALIMTVGAAWVSIAIVRNDPATFEDSPRGPDA
jgi:hypothetical protein